MRVIAAVRHALLVAGIASAMLAAQAGVATADKPPFIPIDLEHIALPAGYQASTPIWTHDGHHLLFSSGGQLHVIGEDGSGLRCISCGLPNDPGFAPAVQEAFKDVFPDGRRVLWGDFERAFILECSPSVLQCDERTLLAIDIAQQSGELLDPPLFGGGVWHLAPDGVHLGWTSNRLDTRPMLVGRLVRESDRYDVADIVTINPPGPRSGLDSDPRGWTNGGALYELKGFVDGGASAIYVTSQFEGNADLYKTNLATGEVTRLTGHPDWDEDSGESPDGELLLLHSDRGMHRVDAAGLVPRRSFIDYPVSINAAIYFVGHTEGFQCDLQPWLLPGDGDDTGRQLGQPLAPYAGGDIHPQNNVPGRGAWNPTSTKVALTEMSYTTGLGPNRLLIANLHRRPTTPQQVVSSQPGPWATPPEDYRGTIDSNALLVTVRGLASGRAYLSFAGTMLAGTFSVVYDHYSDDGASFVSGTEKVVAPLLASAPAINTADLRISGARNGYMKADYTIGRLLGKPVASGHVEAELDGYRLAGDVPKLGGCPDKLPKVAPLQLRASRTGDVVTAHVEADTDPDGYAAGTRGDRRPVAGATVTVAGSSRETDEHGDVTIAVPAQSAGPIEVSAIAGDTFAPATTQAAPPKGTAT
jgi:hypothetical protein